MKLTDLNWQIKRPELGGISATDYVGERRGTETSRQIADGLGKLIGQRVSLTQVNQTTRRHFDKLTNAERDRMYQQRAAAPIEPYGKPALRVDGDALVLADCQVPFHDAEFIRRCVSLATSWKVTNCILAGDFADLQALNSFNQSATMPLSDELKAARMVLAEIKRSFKRVVYIKGNHEERTERSTEGRISFRDLLVDFFGDGERPGSVEFSPLYWCWVGDKWIVTHPKNASSIPSRVPFVLASKFHRNVISTHNHLWGSATDMSGTFHVIDSGMCADPAKIEYYAMRHNTRPSMSQGAVIIRRGFAWPLHPHLSDWVALKRLG